LEEIKIFCPDSEHNGNQQNKHCVLNVSSWNWGRGTLRPYRDIMFQNLMAKGS
jgi:hypothetical protein